MYSMPVDPNVTIRPPKRPAPNNYSDRAQARMIRQKLLEQEQEIEDQEALKVTAEELRILRDSFSSVKAEFTDLDGLSWDTPMARQVLVNWHAQQASLRDELRLGDLALRMRRAGHSSSPRRTLASIIRPPGLSASAPDLAGLSSSTALHEDDGYDATATVRAPRDSPHRSYQSNYINAEAFELTIRVRAHVGTASYPDAPHTPHPLGASTHNDSEQLSLSALFDPVPREYADVGLTPRPHRLSFDLGSTADLEPLTPIPTPSARPRPAALPKSHSAPCVPLAGDPVLRSCRPSPRPELHAGEASTKSERQIKRLPPSRIPIPRSKSLGATASAQLATRCFSASAALPLPASVSAPAVPSRAHSPRSLSGLSLCPRLERTCSTRPPHRPFSARKPVPVFDLDEEPPRTSLGASSALNCDSDTARALGFREPEPASPKSPSTKLYPLSPAHRGRVGYNYRPAPLRVTSDRS